MSDLKVGMKIQRHIVNSGSSKSGAGIINGEPFRRGTKYHDLWKIQVNSWMVPVVTTDNAGKLVHRDWFLADMGVVPYERDDGSAFWNEQNYTLAVG